MALRSGIGSDLGEMSNDSSDQPLIAEGITETGAMAVTVCFR